VYVLFAIAPLVVAFAGPAPEPRSFWIELAVGLGFVGLSMLALQFVITGRFANVARTLDMDDKFEYHRMCGLIAFGFILLHPLILFAADADYLSFLDPRENAPRAVALTAVLAALVLLVTTTLWRQALRIPYEWWRLSHGLVAAFIVFVGLVHILQVGFYVSVWWKQVLWVSLTGAAIFLLVNTRAVRPFRARRTPYRVTQVRKERGPAWTLVVEPRGHAGLRFEPGQFAWITVAGSPFSLQQHPFSFSSSAETAGQLEFTIKELGDFTETVGGIEPGSTAYVEGPYGAFTPDDDSTRGSLVFFAGGVGITPIMSILRTLAARGDPRSLTLVYANKVWEDVLFREDLAALAGVLDLKVVHVLEHPPEGWDGERGRITPGLIGRHLAEDHSSVAAYFICGPEPMMDIVERDLRRRGAPLRKLRSERFKIV
jgi:predicted ferric reductase